MSTSSRRGAFNLRDRLAAQGVDVLEYHGFDFNHLPRRDPPIAPARLAEPGVINHLDARRLDAVVEQAGLQVNAGRPMPDERTLVLACPTRRVPLAAPKALDSRTSR